MASSGLVCGVSLRNTRGGAVLAGRDDAVAVARLDGAGRLDHQLLLRHIDGDDVHEIAEAVLELQRRQSPAMITFQSCTRWPVKEAGVSRRLWMYS